jgi:hypothetical protein
VVCSESTPDGRVVIANLSTKDGPNGQDPDSLPTTVEPAEHPSISQRSVIRCDEVRLPKVSELDRLQKYGQLSITKGAPGALVAKIQQALLASRYTALEVKEILRSQGCEAPPRAQTSGESFPNSSLGH